MYGSLVADLSAKIMAHLSIISTFLPIFMSIYTSTFLQYTEQATQTTKIAKTFPKYILYTHGPKEEQHHVKVGLPWLNKVESESIEPQFSF